MKRNKLPPTISLQYLLNECKKQEQKDRREKIIAYVDDASSEILQIGLKIIKGLVNNFKFFLDKLNIFPSVHTILCFSVGL